MKTLKLILLFAAASVVALAQAATQTVTKTAGQGIQFSVTANGTQPFSYQWQKYVNTTPTNIPGATAVSYTIPALTTADAGTYRVVVMNSAGSTVSNDVVVVVNQAVVPPSNAVATGG